jgi:hypothetical protein
LIELSIEEILQKINMPLCKGTPAVFFPEIAVSSRSSECIPSVEHLPTSWIRISGFEDSFTAISEQNSNAKIPLLGKASLE